ncbi:MAG: FAD-binding oxidoreductase [Candidatus Binatia bacterium]|nr:FAD-binding oxidoreductase [Candidatus Binatia bacterium]
MACEVAILGGGVIGSAIAYELASVGLSVVLFDDPCTVGQATRAATGLLVAGRSRTRASLQTRAIEMSLRLWTRWAKALEREASVQIGYRAGSVLRLPESPKEAENLRAAVDRASESGDTAAWLPPGAVAEMEPLVEPVARMGAAQFKSEGTVLADRLVCALRVASSRKGTVVLSEAVREVVRRGLAWEVRSAATTLSAKEIIIAAGIYSMDLAQRAGVCLPLYPVRGVGMCARVDRAPKFAVALRSLQVVPRSAVEVNIGASAERGEGNAVIVSAVLSELRKRSVSRLPWLGQSIVQTVSCGIRPASLLGRPIVSRVPGAPGLSVAVGHYRSGLALAPLTASVVREIVLGKPRSDVADFFAWPP